MNKLDKIAFIMPRGAVYRYKTGAFGKLIRYAPLTLPALVSLVPPEMNIECEVYDEGIEVIDATKIEADLICISSITGASSRAYRYADYFRSKGKTVVMGGVHATLCPEEAAQHVDSVQIGLGIEIFPQMLRDYKAGKLKPVYRARQDLCYAGFPFPKREIYSSKKMRFITVNSVQATYGCRNKCAFCCTPYSSPGYYHRPVEDVVDEIRQIPGRNFVFVDPSPIEDGYAKELFKAMIPLKKHWASPMTIRIGEDRELLELAVKSGLKGVLVGFETVSQETLRNIRKGFNSSARFYNAAKLLHDNDVAIMGCFVFGLDSDDRDCFKRTLEFVYEADIDIPRFTVNTAYPGTEHYAEMKRQNRIIETDWSMYDCQHVILKPAQMSAEELQAGHLQAWKEAYRLPNAVKRLACSRSFPLYSITSNIAYRMYAARLPGYTRDVMCDYSDIGKPVS